MSRSPIRSIDWLLANIISMFWHHITTAIDLVRFYFARICLPWNRTVRWAKNRTKNKKKPKHKRKSRFIFGTFSLRQQTGNKCLCIRRVRFWWNARTTDAQHAVVVNLRLNDVGISQFSTPKSNRNELRTAFDEFRLMREQRWVWVFCVYFALAEHDSKSNLLRLFFYHMRCKNKTKKKSISTSHETNRTVRVESSSGIRKTNHIYAVTGRVRERDEIFVPKRSASSLSTEQSQIHAKKKRKKITYN